MNITENKNIIFIFENKRAYHPTLRIYKLCKCPTSIYLLLHVYISAITVCKKVFEILTNLMTISRCDNK